MSTKQSSMFWEELDLLRAEVKDAQIVARNAEAEQMRQVDRAATERNRADTAELLSSQRLEEIQGLRHQLSQVRAENARLPELESKLNGALSEIRDLTERLARSEAAHERTLAEFDDTTNRLSVASAKIVDLNSELAPTRRMLKAWNQRNEADKVIEAELAQLDLERNA